jgi:hypothetical protein
MANAPDYPHGGSHGAAVEGGGQVGSGAALHTKTFTSWKLDLLDGMARDPEVRPADFHVAFVIVQCVNRQTNVAIISDHRLQRLVHRDRKALMTARKRLSRIGWMEVQTGRYGRATEYRFHAERAQLLENIRIDEEILAQEESINSGEKRPHCRKTHNRVKTPRYGAARSGEKTPHRRGEAKTPHSVSQWGGNGTLSAEKMHPLHLHTPKRESLPLEDKAVEAYEAQAILECDGWMDEDRQARFDEVAGFLEFDEGLPRPEAEHRARVLCGFDDVDPVGRQGARDTLPTVAKCNLEEGTSDDQEHPYHEL